MPFLYVRFRMCVYLCVSKSAETGPCESSFFRSHFEGMLRKCDSREYQSGCICKASECQSRFKKSRISF